MRLEPPSLGFTHSAPTSPTHAANILATFAKQQSLSAESICPLELLELLVDDYFTYIHPLLPVPHEPSFRDALQRREDLNSSTFLSLLAAMVGALVVSFPRIAMRRLKALRMESLFPNSTSFIDRCHKVSVEARGTGFLDKCLTVYDAATSYLLALTSTYCFKWRQCKLYFGESLTILRTLGVYKSVDFGNVRKTALSNSLLEDRESQRDFIAREMGRRTFWLVHMGIKSLQQLGASYTEMFIPPPTQTSPYPTLPTEVDDFCIFADSIVSQPSGVVSKIVGFNANVRIFQSYDQLNLINMTHGAAKGANWNQQRHVIEHCLTACKQSMECLPPELMLIKGPETTEFSPSSYAMSPEYNSYDRTSQRDGTRPALMEIERSAQERRKVQYEIQKANIYVTGLATRSHIVEKYWTLCDNSQSRDSPLQANSDMGYNNKAQTRGILLFNPNLDAVQVGYNAIRNQLSGQFQPQTPNNLNHSTTSQSVPIFQQGEVDVAMEREEIVRGLLVVLRSVSQINMEPSGAILIHKIRMIASTLLAAPRTHQGALAVHIEQYLAIFLDVLVKLEHGSTAHGDGLTFHNNETRTASSETIMGGPVVRVYGDNLGGARSNTGNTLHVDYVYRDHSEAMNRFSQHSSVNPASSSSTDLDADEEADLRQWASLREYREHASKANDLMADL